MIAPNMATMLAFLTTDAEVPLPVMQKALKAASDATFNTLNVDGATSTNDTAMLLASGRRGKADADEFANAVLAACRDLTMQMARDAEGHDADGARHRHRRGQRRRSEDRGQERSSRTISSNAAGTAAILIGAG